MYIKEILQFRDGGTTGFNVILSVDEKEKLGNLPHDTMITIDSGMNGDGKWYAGLKSKGGVEIEDVSIIYAVIKAFEEKVSRETILLENVKQFL
jgi:anionic cell wall polymer biosynthesis LytR-Cps2A-Psr (LCP) family protein